MSETVPVVLRTEESVEKRSRSERSLRLVHASNTRLPRLGTCRPQLAKFLTMHMQLKLTESTRTSQLNKHSCTIGDVVPIINYFHYDKRSLSPLSFVASRHLFFQRNAMIMFRPVHNTNTMRRYLFHVYCADSISSYIAN